VGDARGDRLENLVENVAKIGEALLADFRG
jgi:hypothetical protein